MRSVIRRQDTGGYSRDTFNLEQVEVAKGPSSAIAGRGSTGASINMRDDGARTLLFDLDTAIQRVNIDAPDHPSAVQLTGVYHNLLRRWAEL